MSPHRHMVEEYIKGPYVSILRCAVRFFQIFVHEFGDYGVYLM
jgi:hypothetical protein